MRANRIEKSLDRSAVLDAATEAAVNTARNIVQNCASVKDLKKLKQELFAYEQIVCGLENQSGLYRSCNAKITQLRDRISQLGSLS